MYPNTISAMGAGGPRSSGYLLDYGVLNEGIVGCCITGCGIIFLVGLGFALIYLIQPLFNAFERALNQTNDEIANGIS